MRKFIGTKLKFLLTKSFIWNRIIPRNEGLTAHESSLLLPASPSIRDTTTPTVNPLLSPPGGLFVSSPFEGGAAHLRGGGGLFNLEKTMVSVLHKELEYEVEKRKYKRF